MKSINDNKEDINPLFFSGLEEFRRLLRNVLVPKKSFNDGEVVTGEGELCAATFPLMWPGFQSWTRSYTSVPVLQVGCCFLGVFNGSPFFFSAKKHNPPI